MRNFHTLVTATTLLLVTIPVDFAQAQARCKSGFVWREAFNGDTVCVPPAERDEAAAQNANANNNRQPGGGPFGPNTCRQGYVWREAAQGDVVCVTPYERDKAKKQNAMSPGRTVRAVPID
ncbi:hypothetical protein [Methylocystis sp.]|uniref:hypothetical protein n=1 Tax=Methylocystis sp. TaxID=1911079 RepID=UPI0025F3F663|nr:hypothetical protein [Methylocystis sp.]